MKPFVLIPLRTGLEHPRWGSREFVRTNYLRKLLQYGLVPLVVGSGFDRASVEQLLDVANGILLPGGGDLHPSTYGAALSDRTRPVPEPEDDLDLMLARRALSDRLPFFGICRGSQALAVASGGALHQDIGGVADFGGEDHGLGNPKPDGSLPNGVVHPVEIEDGSRTFEILGHRRVSVLSEHHQAVASTGPALRIAGRSPRGVAEISEAVDRDHFCFGIQAHPEAEMAGDLEPFFPRFADAVRARAGARATAPSKLATR